MEEGKKESDVNYYSVKVTDVAGLLPFYKKDTADLSDDIKEQKRVRDELIKFVSTLKKEYHGSIVYIGEEKMEGKHLERFLFADGGFMEIMLEPPLILKAEFTAKKNADKFVKALQNCFESIIPQNPIKQMFIEGIKVDDGNKDQLTIETWEKMHRIYLKNGIVFTIAAVVIVALFNAINEGVQIISQKFLGYESNALAVISAVIIAFCFDPVKKFVDSLVSKRMK